MSRAFSAAASKQSSMTVARLGEKLDGLATALHRTCSNLEERVFAEFSKAWETVLVLSIRQKLLSDYDRPPNPNKAVSP